MRMIKNVVPYPIYEFVWRLYHGNFSYWWNLFPLNKKKIFITSYYGKGFGDNGKYIVEEIQSRNSDIEIYWQVDFSKNVNLDDFPKGINLVSYNSLASKFHMATSKVWLNNCRMFIHTPKRRRQVYINTGHGGVPFKKVEKDAGSKLGKFYIENSKRDSLITDYMISNSNFRTKLFKESFWYDGTVLQYGSPKIEQHMLTNKKLIKSIKEMYKINPDEKICLYAPTFRQNHDLSVYSLEFSSLIKELETKFGGAWRILVRLHPNISHLSKNFDNIENVINVTNHSDIQELLISSDALITDYSGIMFEMLHKRTPVFIYAKDYENYKSERGGYFDFEDLPFPFSLNQTQLHESIREFQVEKYKEDCQKSISSLGLVTEYGASKKITDLIMKEMKENEN